MTPRGGSGLSAATGWLRSLSRRDRRALLLGVVILVPALGWTAAVRPWWNAREAVGESVEAEWALLTRERMLLRDEALLSARSAQLRALLGRKDTRLVRSANLALAEATVARRIEGIARDSRALLLEVRSVASGGEETAGLHPIRLNVRLESDFEGLLEFMKALESDPLLVRVVAFSMQPGEAGVMTLIATLEAYAPVDEGAGALDGEAAGPGSNENTREELS